MDTILYFENIEIGQCLSPIIRDITSDRIDSYAEAADDFNPIHLNPELAEINPFGGTVAYGTIPLAFISTLLNENFGTAWTFGGNMDVTFNKPVRRGDTVFAKSIVLGKKVEDGKKIIELSISCENQRGDVIVAGKATVSF